MISNFRALPFVLALFLPTAGGAFVTHVTPNVDDPALEECLLALDKIKAMAVNPVTRNDPKPPNTTKEPEATALKEAETTCMHDS